MSKGVIIGAVGAVLVHILILLFGGIFFMRDEDGVDKTREVELLSETEQQTLEENLDPLRSLGISSAQRDGVATFRITLATS